MPAITGYVLMAAAMAAQMKAQQRQQKAQQKAMKEQMQAEQAAQDKKLKEQRLLDVTSQQSAAKSEGDVADIEIGNLTVGSRSSNKREVKDAPVATAGLRVGV